MSKLQELILELCPNGVEYKKIHDVAEVGTGSCNGNEAEEGGAYPFFVRSQNVKAKNDFQYDEEAIIIPGEGGIGDIFHYVNGKYALHQRVYRIHFIDKTINVKFIYYYMKSNFKSFILKKAVSATVTSIRKPMIEKFEIPIPPPEVQEEIVKILDHFTDLVAELQAELQARQKQYEYYRNKLLTFAKIGGAQSLTWMKMSEIGDICMCKRIMKEQTNSTSGIPFYKIGTFGKVADAYISRELYEDYKKRFSFPVKGEILISASGTIGRSVIYDGKDAYFQDSNIVWIHNDETKVLNKYLYYYYQIVEWNVEGGTIKRLYNNNLAKTKIAVPSLSEQERIVAILDKFEVLVNDLSQGLPAEVAAVQEQYEYYRNKLLSFSRADMSA